MPTPDGWPETEWEGCQREGPTSSPRGEWPAPLSFVPGEEKVSGKRVREKVSGAFSAPGEWKRLPTPFFLTGRGGPASAPTREPFPPDGVRRAEPGAAGPRPGVGPGRGQRPRCPVPPGRGTTPTP